MVDAVAPDLHSRPRELAELLPVQHPQARELLDQPPRLLGRVLRPDLRHRLAGGGSGQGLEEGPQLPESALALVARRQRPARAQSLDLPGVAGEQQQRELVEPHRARVADLARGHEQAPRQSELGA